MLRLRWVHRGARARRRRLDLEVGDNVRPCRCDPDELLIHFTSRSVLVPLLSESLSESSLLFLLAVAHARSIVLQWRATHINLEERPPVPSSWVTASGNCAHSLVRPLQLRSLGVV